MWTIPAIYERGVLRLLAKVNLPESQRVLIALFPDEDDVQSLLLDESAMHGKAFDFLSDPAEEVYRPTDGKPV